MERLISQAEETQTLAQEELVQLLAADERTAEMLFTAADRVRRQQVGDGVHLRGLIEFSNTCRQNCLYCGLRRDNLQVQRYRMEPEKIYDLAVKAVSYGYKTVVLQSGEDP